ncbi:hypothetical protein H4696_000533 [Amycolatopsis lexingtonensis]|uniref:Uncharacterized protein n=1 Tax=Amycolatopsis lexingtonensis TaxID=218822 RepID=A0ABR9HR79_9PSEU|nr:hypothetical protein [Amycolatopsis lexingtonensis]
MGKRLTPDRNATTLGEQVFTGAEQGGEALR